MRRMLNRISEIRNGRVLPSQPYDIVCSTYCDNCTVGTADCSVLRDMVNRLASIEAFLGKQYDLTHLKKIIKSDRDDFIKVGNKVFILDTTTGKISEQAISAIHLGESVERSFFVTKYPAGKGSTLDNYRRRQFSQIGVTVFRSMEAAIEYLRMIGDVHVCE